MEERDDHLVGLNLTVNTNTTEQPSTKRGYLKRPDNWREIAQEHLIFKSIDRTLKKFGLFKIHPSIDHWYKKRTIFEPGKTLFPVFFFSFF